MHVAALVQLSHRRIHERVAGFALAKGLEVRRILAPYNTIIGGLKGVMDDSWVMVQDLKVKVPPDELAQPRAGAHAVILQGIPYP